MKSIGSLLLVVIAAFTMLFGGIATAQSASLIVKVGIVRSSQGNVLVSLHKTPKGFPRDSTKAIFRDMIPARTNTNGVVSLQIDGLPIGTYAIAVIHDEDEDFELNTGLFGIPTEGYGFSNNARGTFGPPEFSPASFSIAQSGLHEMQVLLQY